MYLYEVGVSSTKYHGSGPLTYSSDQKLSIGTVVSVPLRANTSLGVVLGKGKPDSKIQFKAIAASHNVVLPTAQLQLLAWLQQYYPAPLAHIVQLFLPSAVAPAPEPTTTSRKEPSSLPELTDEQQTALKILDETTTVGMLHGDTGTGKTRVYIELTRQTLTDGKSAIILVPEIGLTPQMLAAFESQFPGQVHSIHSGMTDKQRRETWRLIYDTRTPQVVIGPRSALFMPVHDLGLLVVDEAHDKGYKQDQQPYYEATRVAAKLATITGAQCVFGTATPRIADYWSLAQHETPIARMTKLINAHIKLPRHTIIDASNRDNFKRSSVFSETMLDALTVTLSRNEQSLVFLNRRGTARFVSCADCGWHAACPNCDTPLTYHGDKHQLQCHTCGIKQSVPVSCPNCGSAELRYQRRGTKALQSELEKLFPQARIARFDSDNTKQEALAAQYKQLANGDVDIIIGTQVVAKGLDLSNLSLVCIPQADISSYLPDFTADEQTFQLLKQVIGRVGRTDKASQVIIQTYTPNSPIIQAAVDNNWSEFYQQQLEHRRNYNFPPFCYLLQLTTIKASAASARTTAEKLSSHLQKMYTGIEILGPAPRFHEKVQGKYQWQLVVKAKNRQTLLDIIRGLPSGWRFNIDPLDLL